MSKKIVSTLAGLILLLAAVSLHARSNQMQVTVPFGFVAGGKTLPAGNYMVELNTDSGTRGVIVLRGDGQQPILLLVANGKGHLAAPEHSQLVFHRYGTSFFLAELQTEGDSTGRALATSDREKEMARKSRPDQKIVAEARTRP
jgi:hypothetical protein